MKVLRAKLPLASEWQVSGKELATNPQGREVYDPSKISRTWDIQRTSAKQIADLADTLKISHSELADHLLNFALSEVTAGRLVLTVRPVRYELVGEIEEA
mgnify:CR=1 FL=1